MAGSAVTMHGLGRRVLARWKTDPRRTTIALVVLCLLVLVMRGADRPTVVTMHLDLSPDEAETSLGSPHCEGEVAAYRGRRLTAASPDGGLGDGLCTCVAGTSCVGPGCRAATAEEEIQIGAGREVAIADCATSFGGGDRPCPKPQPRCIGYVEGKQWGRCVRLPSHAYDPFTCDSCRCGLEPVRAPMLSAPERLVAGIWRDVLHRDPTIGEQADRYPAIDSGELVGSDLLHEACAMARGMVDPLSNRCTAAMATPRWRDRLPGKLYLWATDFHSAPAACNLPIYKMAGAVVHSEVDYGNCVYVGSCKNRLEVLGVDGNLGFALKSARYSDPAELKGAFYTRFKDDAEFNRVDGFMCSHPTANCELYLQFGKPVIIFATTRLEFGRHDKFIDWRHPDWNEEEGKRRWRAWVQTLLKLGQDPRSTIAANNLYDVKYIE